MQLFPLQEQAAELIAYRAPTADTLIFPPGVGRAQIVAAAVEQRKSRVRNSLNHDDHILCVAPRVACQHYAEAWEERQFDVLNCTSLASLSNLEETSVVITTPQLILADAAKLAPKSYSFSPIPSSFNLDRLGGWDFIIDLTHRRGDEPYWEGILTRFQWGNYWEMISIGDIRAKNLSVCAQDLWQLFQDGYSKFNLPIQVSWSELPPRRRLSPLALN
jgi:hypothetical protein